MAHGDITHTEIPVNDMNLAKTFYAELFGWSIAGPPGFEDYPMWRAPNQISGGGLTQREENFLCPRSYVEVDSIDETLAKVRENGGAVVMEKTPISERSWSAVFSDPDGNHIGLYEGRTDAG
ncbi:MAG: VOC family protein [Cumulibacter sp.]